MLQLSYGFQVAFAQFFVSKFNHGEIRVFTGDPPATANDAEQGTLLGKIRHLDGATLLLTAGGQYVFKDVLSDWVLTATASGDAGWFRYVADQTDTGDPSNTAFRFDGAISADVDTGAEMIFDTVSLLIGHTYSIDQFVYTLPPILGV